MSTTEGFHVPAIPFTDVAGNAGTLSPAQTVSDDPKLKVGTIFGVTVTVKVVVVSQFPPAGVNVYVPEFWLSTTAGLHTPLTALFDVGGNAGTIPPAQIVNDVPKLKTGTISGLIVTFNVAGKAHKPAVGVNV